MIESIVVLNLDVGVKIMGSACKNRLKIWYFA